MFYISVLHVYTQYLNNCYFLASFGLQKLGDEVLVWLYVWSEVQIVCTWSS